MIQSLARSLVLALGVMAGPSAAPGLTLSFIVDDSDSLLFEMENLGPTPGDQTVTSPSGVWGLYTFVHQFDPEDDFAEIGLFVKKLLPVSEVIGTDVISPQIYGAPDFPLLESAVGEFGDIYVATFELEEGTSGNVQQWDWKMTLTAGTPVVGPSPVPDTVSTALLLACALGLVGCGRRWR